jgi:hypothetical protein
MVKARPQHGGAGLRCNPPLSLRRCDFLGEVLRSLVLLLLGCVAQCIETS